MATSCFSFSTAQTTNSTHHHHHHPPSSSSSTSQRRLGNFLAILIASLTRLATKLKQPQNVTSPRKFVSNVSHKAMKMVHRSKNKNCKANDENHSNIADRDEALWQRVILMGDKCQPLDFSGVIYYDENGKQRSEPPPRSPRSTPLSSYLQVRS